MREARVCDGRWIGGRLGAAGQACWGPGVCTLWRQVEDCLPFVVHFRLHYRNILLKNCRDSRYSGEVCISTLLFLALPCPPRGCRSCGLCAYSFCLQELLSHCSWATFFSH